MSADDESLFEFPCQFPIKAIGKTRDDLDVIVYAIVNRHVTNLGEGAIKTRPSKQGNYIAITITFEATSRSQLDAIYQELTACEHILMVL